MEGSCSMGSVRPTRVAARTPGNNRGCRVATHSSAAPVLSRDRRSRLGDPIPQLRGYAASVQRSDPHEASPVAWMRQRPWRCCFSHLALRASRPAHRVPLTCPAAPSRREPAHPARALSSSMRHSVADLRHAGAGCSAAAKLAHLRPLWWWRHDPTARRCRRPTAAPRARPLPGQLSQFAQR